MCPAYSPDETPLQTHREGGAQTERPGCGGEPHTCQGPPQPRNTKRLRIRLPNEALDGADVEACPDPGMPLPQ